MALHTLTLGAQGSPIVFLHGLFGQGRNWQSVGKALADEHRIVMVDLPDHGRSAWTERFDYLEVARRVAEVVPTDGSATVVGHSMGGKVAMLLALTRPDLVRRLVVSDMSPVRYAETPGGLARYPHALNAIDLSTLGSRAEAEELLAPVAPDPAVRAFLLQNLRRDAAGEGWRWQANLPLLERDLPAIADWPEDRLDGVAPFGGPVLWVAGGRSSYVTEEYEPAMDRWFPNNRRLVIKDAGHWVHSEQPEIFTEAVRRFARD
ncbi:alpha/beta fold hydrolase [Nocardioides sp. GY 10113]|uniref:alpha/beta fold hydrolase n=1 Tax=Nocardioides sp. GY 10113 TaxID=2569761 RepID=UPI001F0F4CDA|nr:alpha/beta fold hydrolase [Nocardioides sp. GY 10113]